MSDAAALARHIMPPATSPLCELLDLGSGGPDRFVAPSNPGPAVAVFGGQLVAQALMAAGLTVEVDRLPHSAHVYFMHPVRSDRTLHYEVRRSSDGRRGSHRVVRALQDDREVFILAGSFRSVEIAESWHPTPAPAGSGPQESAHDREDARTLLPHFVASDSFEFRFPTEAGSPHRIGAFHPFWVRYVDRVDLDPLQSACAWAFLSDMGVVSAACRADHVPRSYEGVSADHAIWFHRLLPATEWLHLAASPIGQFGSRGLAHATFHDERGQLVATVLQEASYRSQQGPGSNVQPGP